MNIPHLVLAREPLKVKKLKIGVARKFDLIGPNWVYSFSSFIRLYQTHIVRLMLVLGCWTVKSVANCKFFKCSEVLQFFPINYCQLATHLVPKWAPNWNLAVFVKAVFSIPLDKLFWRDWEGAAIESPYFFLVNLSTNPQ